MKKLEIEKTKPTFIISVLKVVYYLGGLSLFDFQILLIKNFQANNRSVEKIPTCAVLASAKILYVY